MQFAWTLLRDCLGDGASWSEEAERRVPAPAGLEGDKRPRACLRHRHLGRRVCRCLDDASVLHTLRRGRGIANCLASPTFRKNAQGKPLPEHNYGENCAIYDPSKPEGHRFDNIKACLISRPHCFKSTHNNPQVGVRGVISPVELSHLFPHRTACSTSSSWRTFSAGGRRCSCCATSPSRCRSRRCSRWSR